VLTECVRVREARARSLSEVFSRAHPTVVTVPSTVGDVTPGSR